MEIPAEVTRLTGITDADVAGQAIDVQAVEAFVAGADLLIAHNASFDLPFCERLAPGFSHHRWSCSLKDVDWSGLRARGTKLEYLVGRIECFHDAHRAVDDCRALVEVPGHELRRWRPAALPVDGRGRPLDVPRLGGRGAL